jgi:hypothetical protein
VAEVICNATQPLDVLAQPVISTLQRHNPAIVDRFLDEFAEAVRSLQKFLKVPTHSHGELLVLAQDFVDRYKHDSLADIALMLKRGRLGHYKISYRVINAEVLHTWMGTYLEEKAEAYQRKHRQKNEQKTGFEHTTLSPENQKLLHDLRNKINKANKKPQTQAKKEAERMSFEKWAATQTELANTATELELLQLAAHLNYTFSHSELLDDTTKALITHTNEQIQQRLSRCTPAQLLQKMEEAQEPVPHPTNNLQQKLHIYRTIQRQLTIKAIEQNLNNRI